MKRNFKRILGIILCAMLMVSGLSILTLQGFAAEVVKEVYVKDGGTGDGSSAASPVAKLIDAVAAINADTTATSGKIILAGNVTTSGTTSLKNTVPLTITSADKANFKLFLGGHISFSGATGDIYFTNIEMVTNKTGDMYIFAYGNKTVMGKADTPDDVIISKSDPKNQYLSFCGGGNGATVAKVDSEINSGSYQTVRLAAGWSGGVVEGDVNAVINGGTFYGPVAIAGSSGAKDLSILGKVTLTINDGTFQDNIVPGQGGSGFTITIQEAMTLKFNGGTFEPQEERTAKISPYTSSGTIEFKKGYTLDFSGYKGSANIEDFVDEVIFTDKATYTVIEPSAAPPATTTAADTPATGNLEIIQIATFALVAFACLAATFVITRKKSKR